MILGKDISTPKPEKAPCSSDSSTAGSRLPTNKLAPTSNVRLLRAAYGGGSSRSITAEMSIIHVSDTEHQGAPIGAAIDVDEECVCSIKQYLYLVHS